MFGTCSYAISGSDSSDCGSVDRSKIGAIRAAKAVIGATAAVKGTIDATGAVQNGQSYVKHGMCIWHLAFYKHPVSAALIAALVSQAATLSGSSDLVFEKCYLAK